MRIGSGLWTLLGLTANGAPAPGGHCNDVADEMMKDEHAPVHQLDHAEPTVIHHPEQDMTVLARWLQQGMEQGTRFWLLLGGVVLALVAVAAVSSGLVAGKAAGSEAWTELTQAKTPEDRLKIADSHPNTPAAGWAKLLSAREEYETGVDDLTTPGRKELAGPRLKKALDLFQQVAKDAGKDTSQGRRRPLRRRKDPGGPQRARRGDQAVQARGRAVPQHPRGQAVPWS